MKADLRYCKAKLRRCFAPVRDYIAIPSAMSSIERRRRHNDQLPGREKYSLNLLSNKLSSGGREVQTETIETWSWAEGSRTMLTTSTAKVQRVRILAVVKSARKGPQMSFLYEKNIGQSASSIKIRSLTPAV
ncbi:hypothetical protein TNCV_770701 [Trichonephila clavipes]|nr:hypothetical protein TNCV_770701 [Trichonephila clavipes]